MERLGPCAIAVEPENLARLQEAAAEVGLTIATAASVWFLVFMYNKNVVFKERIIAEQDFSELGEEESDAIFSDT